MYAEKVEVDPEKLKELKQCQEQYASLYCKIRDIEHKIIFESGHVMDSKAKIHKENGRCVLARVAGASYKSNGEIEYTFMRINKPGNHFCRLVNVFDGDIVEWV